MIKIKINAMQNTPKKFVQTFAEYHSTNEKKKLETPPTFDRLVNNKGEKNYSNDKYKIVNFAYDDEGTNGFALLDLKKEKMITWSVSGTTQMAKFIELTKTIKENVEYEEEDFTDVSNYYDCLKYLKKVNNGIMKNEVIQWFNDNDIDYYNMSDLDMYIYYIEKNSHEPENITENIDNFKRTIFKKRSKHDDNYPPLQREHEQEDAIIMRINPYVTDVILDTQERVIKFIPNSDTDPELNTIFNLLWELNYNFKKSSREGEYFVYHY